MFVTHYNYVYHLKLVVDFFQWDKIIIMGHRYAYLDTPKNHNQQKLVLNNNSFSYYYSMGGQIAILFTSIFPEKVHKLISLDALKQYSAPEGDFVRRTRGVFDDFQSIVTKLEQGVPSTVTYSQAREKLVNSYQGSIGEKEADVLLLRSLRKKDEDSFEFTRDLRTIIRPYVFSDFTNEKLKAYAQGITCPFLLILARHSVTSLSLEPKEMHQEFLEIYRRASKDFRLVEVDGTHHVHLTHPDVVAPFICKFLQPGNS